MIPLTLGEVADAVGGALRDADPATVVTGSVEYDSRNTGAGGLFVALPGERVDGHDFAAEAVACGALAVLVTRPVDVPRIEVADGIAALTALARFVARRLDATTVGVTGSSGKTSTKDLLAHVLSAAGPTVAPSGSMNNELGLPYTVLRADAATRFLVLEMGARGAGHIAHLTRVAPPHIGVVLNVGTAHLGEFGSREAIAAAKGELVEALGADGIAVLNADDPLVAGMAKRTRARVVWFGASGAVRAEDIELDELGRARFTLTAPSDSGRGDSRRGDSAPVALQLVGVHHVSNALAVAAVGIEVGLSVSRVAERLGSATAASRWRMELTERPDGVVVINDAYNANPDSTRAALHALAAIARARNGRAVAVLGPMAELGPSGTGEHEAIGRLAARLGVGWLIAVGDAARPVQHAAVAAGLPDAGWVSDTDAAVAALRAGLRASDVVLVKASRAASLERVALAITEDETAPDDEAGSKGVDQWASRPC